MSSRKLINASLLRDDKEANCVNKLNKSKCLKIVNKDNTNNAHVIPVGNLIEISNDDEILEETVRQKGTAIVKIHPDLSDIDFTNSADKSSDKSYPDIIPVNRMNEHCETHKTNAQLIDEERVNSCEVTASCLRSTRN